MTLQTPDEITRHLFGKTTKGIKFGLDRIRAASEKFDNPHNAYSSIHVAGTNGKGSACAYLDSVIRAHGFKTGLFTSPHLVRFEERFIIGGRPVSTEAWMDVYRDAAAVIESHGLTFFEATTLIAFELFKREKVDWAIFETGMGGRLDATNIITPKVAAIATIAMDHELLLGSDLASIAKEKLGIVKKKVPLVIARPPQPAIEALVKRHCASLESPCIMAAPGQAKAYRTNGNTTGFTYEGRHYTIGLKGEFQVFNALVALQTLECAGFCDEPAVASGIAAATVPGRFQVVELNNRLVVFDVGHNPNAAEAFVKALKHHYDGLPMCVVAGIMQDKDIGGIVHHYSKAAARFIFTHPKTNRAAPPEQIAAHVPAGFKGPCECIPVIDKAISAALSGSEKIVCVVGSFFTVGEAMTALGIEPYGRTGLSIKSNLSG